jgi:hypothetical protein
MPSADSGSRHEFCIRNREDKLDVADASVYIDPGGGAIVPSAVQSSLMEPAAGGQTCGREYLNMVRGCY